MLSPADADLARRDSVLPGLKRLLDIEALRQTVQHEHAHLDVANLDYVRYKPNTSCLVGCCLLDGATRIPAWGLAFSAQDSAKFAKAAQDALIVAGDDFVVLGSFPHDPDLDQLPRLSDAQLRRKLLRRTMRHWPLLHDATPQMIAYRRGRRYVAKISAGDMAACLRLYTRDSFPAAARAAAALSAVEAAFSPHLLSIHEPYRAIALKWSPGRILDLTCPDSPLEAVGGALADLHGLRPDLPVRSTATESAHLRATAEMIGWLCPELFDRAKAVAEQIASKLCSFHAQNLACTHGDFYAHQVLVDEAGSIKLIDFDEACLCEPESDFANFLAHAALNAHLEDPAIVDIRAKLRAGYRGLSDERIDAWYAASLMRLALSPFRSRQPDWPQEIEMILSRIESLFRTFTNDSLEALVAKATDLPGMRPRLKTLELGEVHEISILRQKPGRRCLIEYRFRDGAVLGKIRARQIDAKTFRLMQQLRSAGLDGARSSVGVPEPIAMIPELKMCLQRKVEGTSAIAGLTSSNGSEIAQRIASALHLLHAASVPAGRPHGLADELQILRQRLGAVMAASPGLTESIEQVLRLAEIAIANAPAGAIVGIHRDFYHDQVLLDGRRIWLLDLDCYADGDPALDAGNFVAHLIEFALRTTGDPHALANVQNAFVEKFLRLSNTTPAAVELYTSLSLARHIWISTLHPDRTHTTSRLIALSQERLAQLC